MRRETFYANSVMTCRATFEATMQVDERQPVVIRAICLKDAQAYVEASVDDQLRRYTDEQVDKVLDVLERFLSSGMMTALDMDTVRLANDMLIQRRARRNIDRAQARALQNEWLNATGQQTEPKPKT